MGFFCRQAYKKKHLNFVIACTYTCTSCNHDLQLIEQVQNIWRRQYKSLLSFVVLNLVLKGICKSRNVINSARETSGICS